MTPLGYKTIISKFYFTNKRVLDSLPKSDLLLFRKHLKLKKVRKGRELFHEGSYAREVFILKRGKVKIYQHTPNGSEQIVYIYTPGEMFGYRPLLCNEKHPASAKTLEECGIYFLSAKHFSEALKKSTALSNILLQNLSHEFTVLVNRIAAFGQKSVKERLALSLLILREKYKRRDGTKIGEIPLSRSDLAAFVGTTIETTARIIGKLKKEKIIKVYGRKIIVHDPETLYNLMD
ncbi:MAG: Crp/Fnr family transcriptional regulator [Bacteroidetes bacterium]|nr:Crp/Fnr family transcriptional regulator [Bacteroidota bacterium]